MRHIKIFLASSIVEFEKERYELKAFINQLNAVCIRQNLYIELKMCEEVSKAVAKERKQDEYNELIRKSEHMFMLFGRDAGQYTIEEFNVAWEQFQSSGSPKLHVYFKQLPEGEHAEKSVSDFMERLDQQLGCYYSRFTGLDEIKAGLIAELVQDGQLDSDIEFRDGQIFGERIGAL